MARNINKWLREWIRRNIAAEGRTAEQYPAVIDHLLRDAQENSIAENDLDKAVDGDIRSHIRSILTGAGNNDSNP